MLRVIWWTFNFPENSKVMIFLANFLSVPRDSQHKRYFLPKKKKKWKLKKDCSLVLWSMGKWKLRVDRESNDSFLANFLSVPCDSQHKSYFLQKNWKLKKSLKFI